VPDKTTVSGFHLSADRKWLAASTGPVIDPLVFTGRLRTDTDITVWDVATGKARGTITADRLLALAPDGRTLAVTVEGRVELWDAVTNKRVKPAPFKFNAIDAAAFSPDGVWLVVSGLNEIAYWKWQDGDEHERLKLGRRVQSLAFSPDSKVLAEGPDSRKTIEVRDLATMKVTQSVDDGKRTLGVEALTFADGGRTLIAGNANLPPDKPEVRHRIHFWDVKTGKLTREIALNRGQPRALDVSPDGKSLAVVLIDGDETILAVWDLDKAPGGEPAPDDPREPDGEPVPLTPREAVEKHAGKEVRVVFQVSSVYSIFGGSVPRGQLPPFGFVPEPGKDDPVFSVLVSGELVLMLDRFGVSPLDPGKFFKGKTVEVVGKIERFDPAAGAPDGKPSYRLAVSDWKKFRVVR
jgi:hypothetical protein